MAKTNSIRTMVWTYSLAFGFSSGDRLLIAMLFPFVLPFFGLNLAQAGMIMSAMSIGYIICSIVGGVLSDRYGRKKLALPAVLVYSLCSALTGFAANLASLIGLRWFVGGAEGLFNAAAAAHISDDAPAEKRGAYMGFYVAWFALLGSFVAPIYATNVGATLGWKWACYLTIIPGIILALIAKFKIKESNRFLSSSGQAVVQDGPKVSWTKVITRKNVIVLILIAAFCLTWLWSWLSFGVMYFTKVRGLDAVAAGFLQSALGIGGFIGMLILPNLSDKLGRRRSIWLGTVIGFLGTMGILFAGASYALTFVFIVITAIGAWGTFPVFMYISTVESVPVEWTAMAVGLIGAIGEAVGIVIAPPILGAIGDSFGLTATMLVGGLCLIVAFLMTFVLTETAPSLRKSA